MPATLLLTVHWAERHRLHRPALPLVAETTTGMPCRMLEG
jgi:hypothetical protein